MISVKYAKGDQTVCDLLSVGEVARIYAAPTWQIRRIGGSTASIFRGRASTGSFPDLTAGIGARLQAKHPATGGGMK